MLRLLRTTILISALSANASEVCQRWFDQAKIKLDAGCELQCAMKADDMSNFHCSDECEDLCKISEGQRFFVQVSDLYPGLTDAERAIAGEQPIKALKAYKLSWHAESLCNQIYHSSRHNDESDACRHFAWAAILDRELGKSFAEQVLLAHEKEPSQPPSEQSMDMANNKQGILAAEQNKGLSDERIMQIFKSKLASGNLTVLKPREKGAKK